MGNEKVFNVSNKLKSYNVAINGINGDINLVQDVIISLELSFKNSTPKVEGKLLIDDLYSLSSLVDWPEALVTIAYTDLKDSTTEKIFKITGIQEYEHSNYKKALEISLQDTFSYKFEHSFISKGFNGLVSDAIQQYIEHFELTEYETDFTSTSVNDSFVVPKHINNLEFFLKELSHEGFYFYQDREGVKLKSLDDLALNNISENDGIFYDETDNQYYKNRIIASRANMNKRSRIIPRTRSLAYDFDTKSMIIDSNNDKTPYVINQKEDNIQDTSGFRDIYQHQLNFNEHTKMIRDSFLSQNKIELVVNGFGKNLINQIYDIKLRGNIITTETQSNGNRYVSGKYICNEMVDKIVGDSFIQKIYLERADSQADSQTDE